MNQCTEYIKKIREHREQSETVNLQKVATILEAVFTKKKNKGSQKSVKDNEQKFRSIATGITKKEKTEWIKAGMPPIKKFLKEYRKKNA